MAVARASAGADRARRGAARDRAAGLDEPYRPKALAIGIGEGAALRAPMAIAVIGGLATSTLLTLVIIPVVYEMVEGVRRLPERLGATDRS